MCINLSLLYTMWWPLQFFHLACACTSSWRLFSEEIWSSGWLYGDLSLGGCVPHRRPPSMRARTRSNSIFRISVRNQYEQYAIAKFCPNQIKHVGKQHSEWYWLKLKITETSSYQFLAWTCQSCDKHIYSQGGKKKITVLISRLKCSSLVSAFWNCHP